MSRFSDQFTLTGSNVTQSGVLKTTVADEYNYNISKLESFKNKLKTLSTTQVVSIGFVGDSITEGGNSTNFLVNGYTSIIRDVLQSRYGSAGAGLITGWRRTNVTPNYAWTRTGTWTTWDPYARGTPGATATITFTGTGADIPYFKATGAGTFTVAVDGAVAVTVDAYSITQSIGVYQIRGLAAGDHTVVLTNTDAAKDIFMLGILPINGTSGLRVDNHGLWGSTVNRLSLKNQQDAILYYPSSLYVIAYTANDYGNQTSLQSYKNDLKTFIDKVKSVGSDVLIFANGERNEVKTIDQDWYTQVNYELARDNNIPLIDLNTKWVKQGYASKIVDTVHPNDVGHKEMANEILKYLFD